MLPRATRLLHAAATRYIDRGLPRAGILRPGITRIDRPPLERNLLGTVWGVVPVPRAGSHGSGSEAKGTAVTPAEEEGTLMEMSYWRFGAMIVTSTVAMFGLMYLNTYALEHVFWSETRVWMAFVMGATMAVIMLSFMLPMYRKPAINVAIYGGAVAVFALTLWLVRSQATVNQVEYMKAMIPHHSIAILTSKRADITDPRVRKLADEIIEAQEREIAEMKYLIADLQARD